MSDNKLVYCSFCNTHKDLVTKLIVSDNVAICSDCIELCNQLILEESSIDNIDTEYIRDFKTQRTKGGKFTKRDSWIIQLGAYNNYCKKDKSIFHKKQIYFSFFFITGIHQLGPELNLVWLG
jgi:hypothetical protein